MITEADLDGHIERIASACGLYFDAVQIARRKNKNRVGYWIVAVTLDRAMAAPYEVEESGQTIEQAASKVIATVRAEYRAGRSGPRLKEGERACDFSANGIHCRGKHGHDQERRWHPNGPEEIVERHWSHRVVWNGRAWVEREHVEVWDALNVDQRHELQRAIACQRPRSANVALSMPTLIEVVSNGARRTYSATARGLLVGAAGGCSPPPITAGVTSAQRKPRPPSGA